MALPRVLVVRGGSLTAGADPSADREWYAWRLIGRNNRELGRSAAIHPDVATCRADVTRLQVAAPRLSRFVVADLDQGLWRWRLESSGEVRAVSARLYNRRRECLYSLDQFLVALPVAAILGHPPRQVAITAEDWLRPAALPATDDGSPRPRRAHPPSALPRLDLEAMPAGEASP